MNTALLDLCAFCITATPTRTLYPVVGAAAIVARPTPQVHSDGTRQSARREPEYFVLILDDYQVITEHEIHSP